MRLFNLSFWVLMLWSVQINAQSNRYLDSVFATVTRHYNVTFGSALPYNDTIPDTLKLDVFEPVGDTAAKRPLVIAVFGGSFITGSKNASDIDAWCRQLAKRGYVTAAPSYRLGFNLAQQGASVRAGYRAIQDVRAAIRYLKANATQYKIDTTQIFMVGNSAGAITALQVAYATDVNRPAESFGIPNSGVDSTDLGCMDCSTNSLPHTVEVKGVIGLWGAVLNLRMLDSSDRTKALLIHGDNDNVVPVDSGYAFNNPLFPRMYGSRVMKPILDSLGIYNELNVYAGQPHNFYYNGNTFPNSYWMPILGQGVRFLCRANPYCNSSILLDVNEPFETVPATFSLYPNPAHNELNLVLDQPYELGEAQVQIFNLQGQLLNTPVTFANQNVQIQTQDLASGMYILQVKTPYGSATQKFIVQRL